jgi:hypothetical protein
MSKNRSIDGKFNVKRVAGIALAVATSWVFLEWLFFVTKPSFMSLYASWEKLGVLSGAALVISATLLLFTLPFTGLGWLVARFAGRRGASSTIIFVPVILTLAVAMLVVIDNFTLTVFGYGIRNAAGMAIYLYRLLSIGLVLLAAWWLHGLWNARRPSMVQKGLVSAALLIVCGSVPLLLLTEPLPDEEPVVTPADKNALPNILILSGDGISVQHMSLYGYSRPTTPFLESVQDEFLVAENHYTNASDTGGSVISMLSGKLPTTTRVIYPPDVLRGRDSFQHLPAMLKTLGYYSADISMRHYADPYDLNLRNGFDEANFRQLRASGGALVANLRSIIRRFPVLSPASLLIDRMSERISERYGHIWKNKKMQDPLAEVNQPDLRWIRDEDRMAEIRRLVSTAPRPFFINVLTMGTHGERFRPTRRVYSTEDDYENLWSVDGYDDAIMDFDRDVEEIYGLLGEQGLLDSTIILISSDHGFIHNALDRVPMMLRLPGKALTGRLGGNTQRLDIAPTLLDFLGIRPRNWMEGNSMLRMNPAENTRRSVFASGSNPEKAAEGNFWSVRNPHPPWYSLGKLTLVYCDQGYVLRLDTLEVEAGPIAGSTAECEDRLSPGQAREIMLAHLKEKGYSW